MGKNKIILIFVSLLLVIISSFFVARNSFSATTSSPTTRKVLVLNFDPYISGTTPLTTYKAWNNITTLDTTYVNDVKTASHNYLNYSIVNVQTIRDYPYKPNGFKFTNAQFLGCLTDSSPSYCLQLIDYNRLITDYNLCGQVNSGAIDEVWLWGGPYFGYYEAVMAGPDAYNTNGGPITGTTCTRNLHIMGFNYERGSEEMLHSFGHRIEGTMNKVFGNWALNFNTAWNRFSMLNKDIAGKSACGNVHFPANGTSDYNYTNTSFVDSRCDDFLNYPSTTGAYSSVNCNAWGCTGYGYMKYWLNHLPYKTGLTNNKHNNWWYYVANYDSAKLPVTYGEKYYAVENTANDYYTSCGQTITNSSEVYLGTNPGCTTNNLHTAYLKFSDVQIPKNAYIVDAYLEFVADGTYTNPLTQNITLTDGTATTSGLTWNISDTWNFYTLKKVSNLTSITQSLVNSSSWVSGKTITLKINHVSGSGQRRFFAFDREGNAGARLVVVTSQNAPTSSPVPTVTPSPSPSPTPAPVTLTTTADSYVSGSSSLKNNNYGTATSISVVNTPNIAYLKFDLASIATKTVNNAKLRIKVSNGSVGSFNVKQTTSSWTETGINYNNRPALGSTITTFTGGTINTWKEIDITSFINTYKGQIVSVAIDTTSTDNLIFNSRNNTVDKPQIIVQ